MALPATAPRLARSERLDLILYFVGAYLFTWSLQLSISVLGLPYQGTAAQVIYILSVMGPLVSVVAVTGARSGRAGLRTLFGKALQWRFSPVWYLMALLTVGAVKVAAIGLHSAMGGAPPERWLTVGLGGLLFHLVTQFGYVMFAEEVGWRAFALPRLLERFGALGGTLLLAVIHGAWHLPMFVVPGSNQYGESFLLYLFIHLSWSVIHSFLYYRTGKSALPCLLFHASLNVWAFVVGMPPGATTYVYILYGLMILVLIPFYPRPLFGRARAWSVE